MKIEFEKDEIIKALKLCSDSAYRCDICPLLNIAGCKREIMKQAAAFLESYERGEALEEARRKMEEENLTDEELFGEDAMEAISEQEELSPEENRIEAEDGSVWIEIHFSRH